MEKDRKEKVKELTEQLHEGIKNLYESEKYREYLKTMSKFTNYSFNNTVLIWMQRPDASSVAGYRAWETKFQRYVKAGAKGIQIIEPAPWKLKVYETATDADGKPLLDQYGNEIKQEVERTFQNFRAGYVFAYEDTEGKPLPSIVSILDQNVDNYDTLMDALKTISPVPIQFREIEGGANGYYDLLSREIVIKDSLPEMQKIKTGIHETAHAILHDKVTGEDPEATQREREVSAESVAFVVANYFGLDTSEYSFGYVGGWSAGKELKEFQDKMEVIRKTANSIITSMEEHIMKNTMPELTEDRRMLPEVQAEVVQYEKSQRAISHRRR